MKTIEQKYHKFPENVEKWVERFPRYPDAYSEVTAKGIGCMWLGSPLQKSGFERARSAAADRAVSSPE